MTVWDFTVAAAALYNACFLPFSLVFTERKWGTVESLHAALDVLFVTDVIVKLRTGYRDRGYDVIEPSLVMQNVRHPTHPLLRLWSS